MKGVIIKSFSGGLKIFINEDISIEDILEEIKNKMLQSGDFFKDSKLCITFEGIKLSEEDERRVVECLETYGKMNVVYIVGKDEDQPEVYKRALDRPYINDEADGVRVKIYKGNVKKGERLEFTSGALIIGDVDPGALVKACGDVIILGGLYGNVTIEDEESDNHFVYANEMSPERIMICNMRYYSSEKLKWSIRPKYVPKVAYVKDKKVVMETYQRGICEKL